MPELIVLTCASGRQCTAIIPKLYSNPQYLLRLVVHSESSQERLSKQYPEAEVIRANLQVPNDCSKIIRGATAIFYVGPTFQPHEATFGKNMIDAAKSEVQKDGASFKHFILSSVLHPECAKLIHHHQKAQIEEYLAESGLAYTILQPSMFMDNIIGQFLAQKGPSDEKGTFMAAFSPDVPTSFSCVRDYADVAVRVVRERERHFYATYQVVSTLPITLEEYVAQVSKAMGKEFEIKQMPLQKASEMYTKMFFGEVENVGQEFKDAPERMLLYYNSRGLSGNPGVSEWLLGRKATVPGQLAKLRLEEEN